MTHQPSTSSHKTFSRDSLVTEEIKMNPAIDLVKTLEKSPSMKVTKLPEQSEVTTSAERIASLMQSQKVLFFL